MLGLVDYGSDSDAEEQQQGGGQGVVTLVGGEAPAAPQPAAGAQRDSLAASQPAAPRLPGAAQLFGEAPAAAQPMQQSRTGAKRGTPDSRAPLPNPLASQPKVPRRGGAASAASGRPPPGVLLPPQLRGRANVATEDLSSMFTKDAHKRLQQRAKESQ